MSPISTCFTQMLEPQEQARIGATPNEPDDVRVRRLLVAYENNRVELAQLHACVREFMAESTRLDWLEKKSREEVNELTAPSLPILAWDEDKTVRHAIDAEIAKEHR